MENSVFTYCELVKVHKTAIENGPPAAHHRRMPRAKAKLAKNAKPRRFIEIGDRLQALREALGISQAELCEEINCNKSRWNQYEQGERKITVTIACRLLKEYGASLDWIYENERDKLPRSLYVKLFGRAA
jgi:ribosome-binding protein aMBF1 (putative translation factor)